ncbi:astacin-like metalloendopeptidase [Dendrobates tinctorius]|uniref:astacin-like metalloendopeptidase n=1 Tax=Dendrobates tinctorius TaxID=92724 RepID=UPI003CC9A56E
MCWIIIICLFGAGGMLQETHSMDSILDINENNISKDNPVRRRIIEGDIIPTRTSRFSPKMSLWPMDDNGNVRIPYILSPEYDEGQKNVILDAMKDVETSTCIHFVKRSVDKDFINIEPEDGCYSYIGRVQGKQELSLAFECVNRGKGVVLHELMHVIGFWHEHSRADRDNYVIIHWKNIREDYTINFCKQETTNMLLDYDFGSLLHYSSIAFSKNREMTIEPRKTNVFIGQRVKLSSSDIARINKLYHCPQDIPSAGNSRVIMFNEDASPPIAGCSETNLNPLDFSNVAFTNSSMASTLSSSEALTTVSPTANISNTGTVDFHTSSPEPKSFYALFPNQKSKSVLTGYWNLSTLEPTHSITSVRMNQGDATVETTRRTATHRSIKDDNSTVFNIPKTTNQEPDYKRTGFTTEISSLGSSVTNSEFSSSDSTTMISTVTESSLLKKIWSTIDNAHTLERKSTFQTFGISQSGEMQQPTTTENTRSSSGLVVSVSSNLDNEHVEKNSFLTILRRRSLAEKTLGSGSEHRPRGILGNKLIYSYNKRRKSPSIIEPFCGFEHGFCGWKQSTEDDLDWNLSWGSMNVSSGHFGPEGFHLSVKRSPEMGASRQIALLLKAILQPSNCIMFWYGSLSNYIGTLNIYIATSGQKKTLLWSSGSQDHVKWTKVKIMLPPKLLYSNAHVVVEGVLGQADLSTIAIDNLYVGQCR